MRKVLTRLLPVATIAVGLFFWRGGGGVLATDRELFWRVPGPYSTVRKVEVQVYDGDDLLKRAEWALPNGLVLDPTVKVPLKEGAYLTHLFVWRDATGQPEVYRVPLNVAGSGPFVLQPSGTTR